jgi:tyrosyl-tRNA synthetase
LLDILVAVGAAPSKTQARTFVEQNSVMVNGEKVTDPAKTFAKAQAMFGKYLVIRRGKKNYYLGEF